jgi:hypothetical protein
VRLRGAPHPETPCARVGVRTLPSSLFVLHRFPAKLGEDETHRKREEGGGAQQYACQGGNSKAAVSRPWASHWLAMGQPLAGRAPAMGRLWAGDWLAVGRPKDCTSRPWASHRMAADGTQANGRRPTCQRLASHDGLVTRRPPMLVGSALPSMADGGKGACPGTGRPEDREVRLPGRLTTSIPGK